IGYTITSGAGSLNAATWDRQSTGSNLSNDNDQWTLISGTSNELAEAVLDSTGADNGGDVPATSGTWSFGNAWRKSPFEDVVLDLLLDDGTILSNAAGDFALSYTGNGGAPFATGDLDYDGDLDPADWAAFKAKFHGSNLAAVGTPASHQAELYNLGDLDVDGMYTLADFNAFEAAYDAANGAGAFAAIPEPTTITLLAMCGATAMMFGRGRNSRRAGRIAVVTLIAGGALFGAERTANAQLPTITNPGTAAAGDKANTSGFAFRADAGTFPASVSPSGSLTDLLLLSKLTLKRPDDATTPSFGTGARQTTSAATPIFLDVYTSLDGAANTFSGYVGSSSTSVAWDATVQNTNYSFDFSNLLLSKSSKYWFVFSEDAVEGEVSNFRHRVATGGSNTGAGDNASGYLLNDTAQVHTQGGGESDWGTEHIVEFAPVTPLTLQVNTTTGAATILNDGSSLNFDINSYSITSANSLSTSGWSSLEDQVVGGDPTPGNKDNGDSWEEFNNVGASFIGEGFLTGSTTIANGASLSLGSIFAPGGTQDLAFTYTATNGGLPAGGLVTGTVEYVSGGGFSADFNNDGDVDGADLVKWRGDFGPNAGSDADNDGDSDGADFLAWQRQLGSTSATAVAAAVPEPSGALLALAAASIVAIRRWRRLGVGLAAVCCGVMVGAEPASAEVFNDRHYSLGDLSNIGFDTQGVNLAAFPGAIDTGAYQDLINNGGVTSTNVGPGGLNRPGLTSAANGAVFDGVDDSLTTAVSLNSPNHTWNTAAFFPTSLIPPDAADDGEYDPPSASGADGPDPDTSYTPAFPHNYAGIFSRGIQLWARPTGLGQARRQDLVMDSLQHGIFITANDTWGLQFDGPPVPARDNGSIDSEVPVASTLDANGWVHVMEISGADAPISGGSAFGGALLVNGVAVVASNTFFDPDTTGFSIGSNQAHDNNFYAGALDEVRVFLWGNNSHRDAADANTVRGYLGGANWGTLNLAEDNDWIKQKLASLGVTSPGDVDLNGVINAADATAFVSHWRKVFTVDGLQVGDWNSRQEGDLDFSGDVDLADAYIAHAALDAVGLALNFELLSAPVPEPSVLALVALGVAGFGIARRRGQGRIII
ncbi:MAG TPA: PEP-CTERM sorting domain-containing protein, partial [Lacipirellula sp.]